MSMEELNALLAAGKLTQAQFTAMAKAINPGFSPEPAVHQETTQEEQAEEKTEQREEKDEIPLQELVQRAVDRATNKLGNENKKLREQLDAVKRTKLTAEEAAELDRQQREEALLEKERALQDRENRLYAVKAIKAAGLDDGSDKALALVDFVLAEEEETIDAKVKAFDGLLKCFVKAQVDKTFQAHGGVPEKGGGKGVGNNPYAKDAFNITEQMRLETETPELAKQFKAAAEVK